MIKGGGKQKGSAFERRICKELSLWASGRTRDDLFWRSAMSGGAATLRMRKGSVKGGGSPGDISPIGTEGEFLTNTFIIELKAYKNIHLESLFYDTPKNGFQEFWVKLLKECKDHGKLPLLIFKENGKDILVSTNREGLVALKKMLSPMTFDPIHLAEMYPTWSDIIYILNFDFVFRSFNDRPTICNRSV